MLMVLASILLSCRCKEVEDCSFHFGRPCLSVDMYEVEYLRSLGFSWTNIALLLGISRSTLYRRMESSGLTLQGYSTCADDELDRIVNQIKTTYPNDGEVMVAAHLKSRGIYIPRARLCAAIYRLDPSTREGMRSAIRRRVYHTQSPNSVWHIDGNHKLIRWRLVVHGGIDGYSRLVVFLRCSSNNQLLSCFQKGVETYGLPNKVRSDLGGENVSVWRYVLEKHGNASTHNERIERLWRDVHRCVLKPFADRF